MVPVVLFHSGLGVMRGGFVGVDVFFVISGYLITSLIVFDMHEGSFRLLGFYQRRILRIFPALLLVVAATAAFGWAYSLPEDYRHFGESTTSIAVFLSNIYFWRRLRVLWCAS